MADRRPGPVLAVALRAEGIKASEAEMIPLCLTDAAGTPTYVFLEANPSPMFLGFEEVTGLPLTEMLLELLTDASA